MGVSRGLRLLRVGAAVCNAGLAVLGGLTSAHAEVAMTGTFTATQVCPAYQSIRKSTNPGAMMVSPGQAYDVIAKNKPDVTHYRLHIDGAQPAERWVWASCGHYVSTEKPVASAGAAAGMPAGGAVAGTPMTPVAASARATHVLSVSWEPSFCAKHGDKSECRELNATSFGATHLSLHGLWPQPRGMQYCNVAPELKQFDQNHDWSSLPEPEMSAETLKRLSAVMPGVISKLQRHEWIVHGTCFGGNADGYFARAVDLAEELDASKVAMLFASSSGGRLSASAIRSAFDDAFGAGAGARVAVACGGRGGARNITELVLNLAGDVPGSSKLGDLMRAAPTVLPGCPSGIVASVR